MHAHRAGHLRAVVEDTPHDIWDALIQLCDALGDTQGVVLLETRLLRVAQRHGVHGHTMIKWEAFFSIKKQFDRLCGQNIYRLFEQEIRHAIFDT